MNDVELQFAKDIIGWKNAVVVKGSTRTKRRIDAFKHNGSITPNSLCPTDIRAIIKYAKRYCARVKQRVDMNCLYRENACVALMQACLDLKKIVDKSHSNYMGQDC
jgi:hypothetical protein